MQHEAQQHEEDDKKRVGQINVRNGADTLVYSMDKTLTENDAKIPDDIKADIRFKVENLKEVLKTEDYDTIKSLHEELVQASYKMSEALYKNADAPNPEPQQSTQDDNVIEAEVVE
jgi:molecular chaperone DnaK